MGYSGISPKDPTDYRGIKNGVVPAVSRNRRPTSDDYRQPETGRNYPITCIWQVGASPTTGSQGELWLLSKIVANVATWIQIGSGGGGALNTLTAENVTVLPSGAGDITFQGTVVDNGANGQPLYARGTEADPTHDMDYQIQVSTTVTPTPGSRVACGILSLNENQFQIDSTSGMASLKGSTTAPPIILFALDDGNSASADVSGVIDFDGAVVNNATNAKPLFTKRTPLTNDIVAQIQVATTSTDAAKSVNKAGIMSANSVQFDVDATTGFFSLKGSVADPPVLTFTGTGGGSVAIGPDANGNIFVAGAGGAVATTAGNTITVNAAGGGGGVTWRETVLTSDSFASGGEGIFGNNASDITLTLPASPSVGDTFAAYQEGAGNIIIQLQGADIIRHGNQVTSAGGTLTSLNQGDSVWIVAIDATRFRIIHSQGSWVTA